MLRNQKSICWALKLPPEQLLQIQEVIDGMENVALQSMNSPDLITGVEKDSPFLLFTSLEAEKQLTLLGEKVHVNLEMLPRALVLPAEHDFDQVISAIDAGVAEIIRPPLSEKRLQSIISRALEAELVHHDIRCMTREILLERELLERKNEILSFMVNFMARVSQSMDYETILRNAFECLTTMIPATTMHAAFWKEGNNKEVILCIDADHNAAVFEEWKKVLLKEVFQQTGISPCEVIVHALGIGQEKCGLPRDGHFLSLPITSGQTKSGVLLLVGEMKSALGRDQVEALEMVLRHLGLVLANAELYEIVKSESEIDVLTGLYNRRHFEKYINQEMERFRRYHQPMSFMLIDIDHFKKVNDSLGHDAGDFVLCEVAKIIKKTLRTTDYCARFGGEEFSIIMPGTQKNQALLVAERLRKEIASHLFMVPGAPLRLTVSMGISFLSAKDAKNKEQLIREADDFLYKAKRNGRNCIAGACPELSVVNG